MGKIKFYIAFGGLVLVCVLSWWGFRGKEARAGGEAVSEFSKDQRRNISSEDSELTKETVLMFLEEQRRNILSKNAKIRQQAVSTILQERHKNISLLLGHIVQDDSMYRKNPDSVVAAMRLLGRLRAKEAVGVLAGHLDFQAPGANFPSGGGYHVLNGREAVFALIEIGKPSIPAVIEVLREENYIKLACAAGVIERVEGKEVGAFYLQNLIEKETDPKKQAILRKLKQIVERPGDKPLM